MMRDYHDHRDAVQGSPLLFLADGYDMHNPGIELHWVGDQGAGYPVVDKDDPIAVTDILHRPARTN
jgi:hypothetical protein